MLKSCNCIVSLAAALTLTTAAFADMSLTSSDIAEGQNLDNQQEGIGFGWDGDNLSPPLSWTGAPENTKSYVMTAYDPDAPTSSGL